MKYRFVGKAKSALVLREDFSAFFGEKGKNESSVYFRNYSLG